ncbi:cytochrome b [Methylovirgula sp. 4M-Z18]|uniref:cytochrome b n=1 Tax=Methylovirgula sp. 4M-Z18 TaxID=2293567 RepID=UPI000E2E7177|nr:cytochrome b [Methylovirgula sp. 4M-Z18]RFB80624.1 cytochrome b [Methylovirgula sp. 4M-Z18]
MSALSNESAPVSTASHYDAVQRALHWLMAAIILVAIAIGFYCSAYLQPGTPVRMALLDIHKSLGMTALVLVVIRILYRLAVGAPRYSQALGKLNHLAAGAAHFLLYGLMLGMPLSGYLYSAAGGHSVPWFGLFDWPVLVPRDQPLSMWGRFFHHWGADIIYVVLGVHLLAVAWHQFVKKDDVLARMLPPSRR